MDVWMQRMDGCNGWMDATDGWMQLMDGCYRWMGGHAEKGIGI